MPDGAYKGCNLDPLASGRLDCQMIDPNHKQEQFRSTSLREARRVRWVLWILVKDLDPLASGRLDEFFSDLSGLF